MNGLALHGGFIPYGGTFLCFADYARGAMRLSALMGQRVIYVMTHDSIGLGEDGPTHQPIEHLAMLRATPEHQRLPPGRHHRDRRVLGARAEIFRPAERLVLSRQNLPMLRHAHAEENRSSRGAYVLRETAEPRAITLMATGSEVEIACAAADMLRGQYEHRRPPSSRCRAGSCSKRRTPAYRRSVLAAAPRIAIEAAARLGWDRWIGENGAFIGMQGFGASAPAPDLYRHFNITPENIVATARKLIN